MEPTDITAHPRRHARDATVVLVGAALLVLFALPVEPGGVSRPELAALRAINGVPDVPFALAWLPMHLGSLAVLVGLLRIYVGAHLPLDILGGAALGLAAGGAVHLVVGSPAGPPAHAVPGARGAT